jgi:hypothetical protein
MFFYSHVQLLYGQLIPQLRFLDLVGSLALAVVRKTKLGLEF